MKYNGLLKKLAAGVTTVAMLCSLGVAAFAAPENLVDGSGINITDVTAKWTGEVGAENYTVTLTYTGVDDTAAQVSVLGYVFGTDETQWDIQPVDTAIKAVDQDAHSAYGGTITIKLAAGVREITNQSVLAIKVGSDDADVKTAQAVIVDLKTATKDEAPLVVSGVVDTPTADVSYGAETSAVNLTNEVTVSGTRNGAEDTGKATVDWDLTKLNTRQLGAQTVTGTLSGDNIDNAAGVKATATVTVVALTTGTAAAPADTVEVAQNATAATVAAKIGKITVANGDITDTYTVTAEAVTVDTANLGATTATVSISGVSDNKIFNLTEAQEVTVNINVVEGVADVLYGDVNEDTKVNMQDVALALQGFMRKVTLSETQTLAADVNGDTKVNMQDVALILQRFMRKIDSFPVEQ